MTDSKTSDVPEGTGKTKNVLKKIIIVISLVGAYLSGNNDVLNHLISLL